MHLSLPRFEAPECVVVGGLLTYFLCAQNSCRECLNGSPRGLLFSFSSSSYLSRAHSKNFVFFASPAKRTKESFRLLWRSTSCERPFAFVTREVRQSVFRAPEASKYCFVASARITLKTQPDRWHLSAKKKVN